MLASAPHPPPVAATLATWHEVVASHDMAELASLLHPDATFRSPMAFRPHGGGETVNLILATVSGVFENFAHHRELATDDGLNVVLEFSARSATSSSRAST